MWLVLERPGTQPELPALLEIAAKKAVFVAGVVRPSALAVASIERPEKNVMSEHVIQTLWELCGCICDGAIQLRTQR
jgi:hypothetical protein